MKFELSKNLGECVELPVLVLNRLTQSTEAAVRTVLYILYKRTTDAKEISSALNLKIEEVESALVFWFGAGLLVSIDEKLPLLENNVDNKIKKRLPRLSQREVVVASQKNPEIAILMEECQNLFGEVLSPHDATILVSLYVSDGLPVDLILIGVSHFLQIGKRGVSYIEKRLLGWQQEGITTCEAAERYLALLEARALKEKYVAELFEVSVESFTSTERTKIASWYEDFAYDDEMVYQAFLRSGVNKNVKYLNGILRNWYAKNIRTPKDIADQPQNVASTSITKHNNDDYVAKKMYQVPTLKKKERKNG